MIKVKGQSKMSLSNPEYEEQVMQIIRSHRSIRNSIEYLIPRRLTLN